jgi:TatD DNase family protein
MYHSGVLTYRTNLNTAQVIRDMVSTPDANLRILLETDAPYMVPSNIYAAIPTLGSSSRAGKLPLSHASMIPWTAAFVADVANSALPESYTGARWNVSRVLEVARVNAGRVYGV